MVYRFAGAEIFTSRKSAENRKEVLDNSIKNGNLNLRVKIYKRGSKYFVVQETKRR